MLPWFLRLYLRLPSFFVCLFCFLLYVFLVWGEWYWSFNSGLLLLGRWLPLESYLQTFLVLIFWQCLVFLPPSSYSFLVPGIIGLFVRKSLANFLPVLVLNFSPSSLCLLSSWECRCEPLHLFLSDFFYFSFFFFVVVLHSVLEQVLWHIVVVPAS
jgi:hypothetical protein